MKNWSSVKANPTATTYLSQLVGSVRRADSSVDALSEPTHYTGIKIVRFTCVSYRKRWSLVLAQVLPSQCSTSELPGQMQTTYLSQLAGSVHRAGSSVVALSESARYTGIEIVSFTCVSHTFALNA